MSYWEFELWRVKLYRKSPEEKGKLVRVSGRLELARVPVIGSQLYLKGWELHNQEMKYAKGLKKENYLIKLYLKGPFKTSETDPIKNKIVSL